MRHSRNTKTSVDCVQVRPGMPKILQNDKMIAQSLNLAI